MGAAETTYVLERIAAAGLTGGWNGATPVNIVGYNGSITTSYETIWDESNAYSFLTAAMSTPYVASSDANDTSAGTGARTVKVYGVNTSFAAFTETVTLNGQTSVNLTTANVLAINKMEVLTAGSGGVNAGIISLGTGANTGGDPAVAHGHIAAGVMVSRHGFYVVPANSKLMVCGLRISGQSATAGALTAAIKQAVDLTGLVKEVWNAGGTNADAIQPDLRLPLVFEAKSKLNFMLLASAGAGPATLFASCVLLDTQNTTDATSMAKWI